MYPCCVYLTYWHFTIAGLIAYVFIYLVGNGFKLFRMIRDKSDEDNLQDPPQTQVLKKSWFSTLFQSDKSKLMKWSRIICHITTCQLIVEHGVLAMSIIISSNNGSNIRSEKYGPKYHFITLYRVTFIEFFFENATQCSVLSL